MSKRKSRVHAILMGTQGNDCPWSRARVFKCVNRAISYAEKFVSSGEGFKKKTYEIYSIEHITTKTRRFMPKTKDMNAKKKQ